MMTTKLSTAQCKIVEVLAKKDRYCANYYQVRSLYGASAVGGLIKRGLTERFSLGRAKNDGYGDLVYLTKSGVEVANELFPQFFDDLTVTIVGSKNEVAAPQQIAMGEPIAIEGVGNLPSAVVDSVMTAHEALQDSETHTCDHLSTARQHPEHEYTFPDGRTVTLCEFCASEAGFCTGCGEYQGKDMSAEQSVEVEQTDVATVFSFGTVTVCDKCAGIETAPITLTIMGTPTLPLSELITLLASYGMHIESNPRPTDSSQHAYSED